MDLCLIVPGGDLSIPNFTDDNLYHHFKPVVLDLLPNSEIIYFGMAPDNTADNQDDLLLDGQFFRIVCPDDFIPIDLESEPKEVLHAFGELVAQRSPFWSSVIVERGFIKTETTIEFLYK